MKGYVSADVQRFWQHVAQVWMMLNIQRCTDV